ncbi:hypothetical protein CHISP_3085 [Chitinispirillum alkaliphilum]|nr:hypothetical protein CHISP_3085 [Chitinispirillum alkaliphilum]
MVMSASTRKRIREIEMEDRFPNPEFEPGPKQVPQAELQHVAPVAEMKENGKQGEISDKKLKFIHDDIVRRLRIIEEQEQRISQTLSEIDEEKNCIRNLIEKIV